MPLTPADVHNMAFRKSSVYRRGYDEEEVDTLLDTVTQEMIQLLEENDALREEAHRAGAGETAAAESELPAVSERLDRARRALDVAEQNARNVRSRLIDARRAAAAQAAAAQAAADPVVAGNDRVLAVAQRTADQHLRSADQEARELLGSAREESERITRDARQTADDLAEDARRRDGDAAAELRGRRSERLKEIDELTEFAAQYRAALEDHMRRADRHSGQ